MELSVCLVLGINNAFFHKDRHIHNILSISPAYRQGDEKISVDKGIGR